MLSSKKISDNLRGALYMTLAMFGFATNDLVTKSFKGEMGLGQLVFLRGLFAIALVFFLARALGHLRPLRVALQPRIALRSLGEVISTYCFITALFHMPLANLSAVMQALPLAITLGAMMFLGEPVGWRRILAIIVGFCGVLVIVRPGPEGFGIYSLYALSAVAGCVLRDLMTRKLAASVPSLFVTLVTASVVTTMGGLLSLFEDWQPVGLSEIARMAGGSVLLITGYFFAVTAMRVGDIGFVSPFRYFVLIFSIGGAALFYAEYPDPLTLAGAAIVVATGIYTLYRERVVRRRAIMPEPVEG